MNYQQAITEHYRAVRARIANPKAPQVRSMPKQPEPTEDQVAEALKPKQIVIEERPHSDPRVNILRQCAKEYGCTVNEIMGACRMKNVILARRKAMWMLNQRGTMSLAAIGRFLNKDHSTVIHALKKHEKSLAQGEAK